MKHADVTSPNVCVVAHLRVDECVIAVVDTSTDSVLPQVE